MLSIGACSEDGEHRVQRPDWVRVVGPLAPTSVAGTSTSTQGASVTSVASVDRAILPLMRGEVPVTTGLPTWRSFDGQSRWRFFRASNELSDQPLVVTEGPVNRALIDRDDPRLPIPRGFGAALSIDLEDATPLWFQAVGSFAGELEPTVTALFMSDETPPVRDRIEPGSLRHRIASSGLGAPRALGHGSGKGSARLFATPPKNAKSVLILATSQGGTSFLDTLQIWRLSPLRSLIASRAVDETLFASIDVDGLRRPSWILLPGSSVTSAWFTPPEDGELELWLGRVTGPSTAESSIEVRVVADGGAISTIGLEPPASGWAARSVSTPAFGASRVQIEFVRGGLADAEADLVCVATPQIVPRSPDRTKIRKGKDVVLISIDTLRADRLGCYGHSGDLTPNLDALADDAVRFDRAYTHAPWTLPSHVSLFSGMLPAAHGVLGNRDRIPAGLPLLSEHLQERGYRTAGFTAGGYLSAAFGQARGFDVFSEVDPLGDRYFPGHMTGGRTLGDGRAGSLTAALSWLGEPSPRPGYLLLHTFLVHCYLPERTLAEEHGLLDPEDPPLDFEQVRRFEPERVQSSPLSAADAERMVASYDATVRAADRMVGDVVDSLKSIGRYDDTVLIVTADHGQELFDHGSTGHGVTLYEEMLRVPLIIRAPGAARGHVVHGRVRLVDVLPTILSQVDDKNGGPRRSSDDPTRVDGGFAGVALDRGLRGEAMEDRTVFASVHDPARSIRSAVIANGYKLVDASSDASLAFRPRAPIELYALDHPDGATADAETENLATQAPRIVDALRARLLRVETEAGRVRDALGGAGAADLSGDLLEVLRQMGYLGGG